MAGKYDGNIRIDSSINSNGFNDDVNKMGAVVKKLGAAIAVAFSIGVIVKFTASVAKLSAEFQRLEFAAQVVGQLQGIAASETRALVSELVDSGIQTDTANRSYINFAKDGLDTSLLPALARGAQNLATFANSGETSSDMLDRLTQGILTMNSLMLRNAKVSVDIQGAWKEYAATLGKTSEDLTIAEKRHAVLLKVMERLQTVQGLYNASQGLAAGQLQSNIRVTNELKRALGDPFQVALFNLIKAWNGMLKSMTAAISAGGALHGVFVRIGAIASILAQILAKLFSFFGSLFKVAPVKGAADAMEKYAGGGAAAAESQDALAESTEAAGEAAKGALAGFDKLQVLQQADSGAGDAGGAGGAADLGVYGEVNLDEITNPMDEIIAKAEEMKKAFADSEIGAAVLRLFAAASDLFSSAIEALRPLWEWFNDNVLETLKAWTGDAVLIVLGLMAEALERIALWINYNQGAFRTLAAVAAVIVAVFLIVTTTIGTVIAAIIGLIFIIANAGKAWQLFKDLFLLAVDTIKNAILFAFRSIVGIVKGSINLLIGFINTLVSSVVFGINAIIGAANTVGSILPGFTQVSQIRAPRIPRLAEGAVIPPGAQFAAILGDQKSGRNLEAPESLIRQIVREESGGGGGDVTIKFEGSLAELGRILKPVIDKENTRVGGSLITGGAIS